MCGDVGFGKIFPRLLRPAVKAGLRRRCLRDNNKQPLRLRCGNDAVVGGDELDRRLAAGGVFFSHVLEDVRVGRADDALQPSEEDVERRKGQLD